jgi:hypothetical protein
VVWGGETGGRCREEEEETATTIDSFLYTTTPLAGTTEIDGSVGLDRALVWLGDLAAMASLYGQRWKKANCNTPITE